MADVTGQCHAGMRIGQIMISWCIKETTMLSPLCTLSDDVDNALGRVAKQQTVLRLDVDSNLFCSPHPDVLAFAQWTHRTRRGLLAYAIDRRSPNLAGTPGDLDAFDEQATPNIQTRAAFETLIAAYGSPTDDRDEFLARCAHHERRLTVESACDREAAAFAAVHFQQLALPASPVDVQTFGGGVHGLFLAFTSAVSAQHGPGSVVLTPIGLHLSRRHAAELHGGSVDVVEELTGAVLAEWLERDPTNRPCAIYVPAVNPLTGRILTRRRAQNLARVVLQHNQRHRDKPVFVFADDSAIESCHTEVVELDVQPIGSVTGAELGDTSLGRMIDWTVSTVSPTMALPTSRIAFSVTHNRWLRRMMRDWSKIYGHTSTSALDELVAAAALCLPSKVSFDEANDHAAGNLRKLRDAALSFNVAVCGFDGLTVEDHVAGGWHTTLRFHRNLLPPSITNSFDLFTALLEYDCTTSNSARTALLPGELFGWSYDPETLEPQILLRVNLSATSHTFDNFLRHLETVATGLWEKAWETRRRSAHETPKSSSRQPHGGHEHSNVADEPGTTG